MITAEYLRSLEAWIARGADDREKNARTERVRRELFPPGISDEERARREALIAEVLDAADPIPAPPSERRACAAPLAWEGLVSRRSPAWRRGSRHDGTADEVERMSDAARGDPFRVE